MRRAPLLFPGNAKATAATQVAWRCFNNKRVGQTALAEPLRQAGDWGLDRTVVHVIDREADSLGDFRDWDDAGYRFLIRYDERRVL